MRGLMDEIAALAPMRFGRGTRPVSHFQHQLSVKRMST